MVNGHVDGVPTHLVAEALFVSADIILQTDNAGVINNAFVSPSSTALPEHNQWVGLNIRDVLEEESVQKVDLHLADLAQAESPNTRTAELNHKDGSDWGFPVRYSILCDKDRDHVMFVGRDMTAIAAAQQDLVTAQLALEADYESSRDFETRYRAVLDLASDPMTLVNLATGAIEDINIAAADLLGESAEVLRGSDFLNLFEERDKPVSLEAIINGSAGKPGPDWPATIKQSRKRLTVVATPIRSAGTRYALCRLETQRINAEHGDLLTSGLRLLFEEGVDAIVFTNRLGVILNCNNSFLDLCDAASASDVINRPLADFLSRGTIDQKMLIEGGAKTGQLRSYNTKVVTNYRTSFPVNVSATMLADSKGGGFGFVIRIMRSVETATTTETPALLSGNQNISKLVGAAPLKEIVAGTTDVIERICVEAAIELTDNNRVAAAEMLGLSRQSLYVKLRKFGLLDKSE